MATEPMLCPFCDAQPYVADPTNFPGDWEHPYEHKGCFLDGFHITDHSAWNRRPPPSSAGWLPISTAAKDGTWILIAYPVFEAINVITHRAVLRVRWSKSANGWDAGRHILSGPVDAWMPLPVFTAPSQEGAAEGEGE